MSNAIFNRHNNAGYRESLKGVRQKTLAYGLKTLMVEFRLREGAVLPLHRHPHEQTGYLVSGRLDLTIGKETRQQGPGDSWCIPGDTEHGATALEDSVAVEVFAPVREDYLPQVERT
jgi:quercetin dioxygenase-like cupin family protein